MGNRSSNSPKNIESILESRKFRDKQHEEQADEYPTKLIKHEDMEFFADGDMGKVKSLLGEGYDPSSRDNKPLSLALRNNHVGIVRLLLQNDKVREKLSESDKRTLDSLNIIWREQPSNAFRPKKKSARKTKKSARKSPKKSGRTKKSVRKSHKSARKNRK